MADETEKSLFERHPAITKYVVTVCTFLLIGLVSYAVRLQSKDPTLARGDYSLAVTDTGASLPSDEPIYVHDSDSEMIGKRYAFVGKLTDPYEYNGRYWYKAQSFLYPNWTCFVACETELQAEDTDEFVRIEGLVCGCFSLPTGKNSGAVATTYPALLLREITHGDALEMSAPLIDRVEPNIGASSEEGVSVTLDALEYREGLTLAWVTLRNESGKRTVTGDLSVTGDGKDMESRIGDYYGDAMFRDQVSSNFNLSANHPYLTVVKGEDVTCLLALSPADPHLPLEFCFSYHMGNDKGGGKENGGSSTNELVTVTYDPEQGTS